MKDTLYGTVLQTGKCELPLLREWRDKKKAKALRLPFLPGFMLVVRFRNSGVGERLGHMNDRVMPILQRKLSMVASRMQHQLMRHLIAPPFPPPSDFGVWKSRAFREKWDVYVPELAASARSGSYSSHKWRFLRKVGRARPRTRGLREKWDVLVPEIAASAISGTYSSQNSRIPRDRLKGSPIMVFWAEECYAVEVHHEPIRIGHASNLRANPGYPE